MLAGVCHVSKLDTSFGKTGPSEVLQMFFLDLFVATLFVDSLDGMQGWGGIPSRAC